MVAPPIRLVIPDLVVRIELFIFIECLRDSKMKVISLVAPGPTRYEGVLLPVLP